MPKSNIRIAASLITLLLALSATRMASAQEWSQFRGPNGTGVSATVGLPTAFGPKQNVVWKTELPPGHSSPVLARDRIFITAFSKTTAAAAGNVPAAAPADSGDKNHKLLVFCLDRQSGKVLWQREVPRTREGRLQNVNNPASPSPVTDGTNVYAFFQEFGLISFDRAGKERWRYPLGPFNMFYGFGASPILVDDKVILPIDQDNPTSYLIAVDKNTGKLRWKVDRPVSSPVIQHPSCTNRNKAQNRSSFPNLFSSRLTRLQTGREYGGCVGLLVR